MRQIRRNRVASVHGSDQRTCWVSSVRPAALLFALTLVALPSHAELAVVEGARGVTATIDEASGRYEVRSQELHWTFAGQLGSAPSGVRIVGGKDRLGAYHELRFGWRQQVPLTGSIRAYASRPVVLFHIASIDPIDEPALIRFPRFTEFPTNLRHFSYQNAEFAPRSFALEGNGTPWLLFDDQARAVVISPAANFMVASMHGDGNVEIASGLNDGVTGLPAGFAHATLLAFGIGVNSAWDDWGTALTELQGKHRPPNDADIGLRYLGYWTDNGADYYYEYEHELGYAGTLKALVKRYRKADIPIRYLQLDSWWYSKTFTDPTGTTGSSKNPELPLGEWNRYGGLERYEAHPALFPGGLAAFQQEIGLPLITHNRWIDPESPYHKRFGISGFAAVDPRWWNEIVGYLASAGVVTYEQDWLNVIYEHSPALATTLQAGDQFTDGMAHAAQEKGLSVQYCMALPRFFLQSARYDNLTSIRVSGDRLMPAKWDTFLYTSRFASALGVWPWTDVFMSTETDNLLIATLSSGMLGIGDRIGTESKESLMRSVRTDGVIVKPDVPLLPIDAMYTSDAAGSKTPMIASAHTDHGALRTAYVFIYSRDHQHAEVTFTPRQVGMQRDAYLYDTQDRTAHRLSAAQSLTFDLAPSGARYFVLASVSRAGVALFGDDGKFVPDGRKRVATVVDGRNELTATVVFAPGEDAVRLFGYATRRPTVAARVGSVSAPAYDKETGRFEVSVSPSGARMQEGPGKDVVQRAIISIH
jgi:hypothetical protein